MCVSAHVNSVYFNAEVPVVFMKFGSVFPRHGTVPLLHVPPILLQTLAINRARENNKQTLIVDYINKNIFVLSLTLIIYFATDSTISFSVSGRPFDSISSELL